MQEADETEYVQSSIREMETLREDLGRYFCVRNCELCRNEKDSIIDAK